MSTFIVIDKKSGNVNEVVKHVVYDLKLPPNESYELIFEEPKAFLTSSNLHRVHHGFMLTVTAAAKYYVMQIDSILASRSNFDNIEWALSALESFSSQSSMFKPLLAISAIYVAVTTQRYWVEYNFYCPRQQARYTCYGCRAKREDSNVVLIALQMIEQLLNSDNAIIRQLVLAEVPPQSLIRHLEKSDERVALAALSLMNALHDKSDVLSREEIVKHLASVPFRTAISGSVLREGRARNTALLGYLVSLERLLIQEHTKLFGCAVMENEINALLVRFKIFLYLRVLFIIFFHCQSRDVVRAAATGEPQLNEWKEQLLTTHFGKLAIDTFSNYADQNAEDLRIVSKNSLCFIA
ncbi:hypothetical protein DICVIV_02678 [Dictyocaulus viviparus]|uniref:ELMO armadillo-like helical domain-containing protein n=1 Tax=Dictyocaulus viviparus TaxID=29172 RepID=A0A0D8Y533_DICVI|nr:hypothetical protein DICVIV_02678 [Dictyocaulus viviparus]